MVTFFPMKYSEQYEAIRGCPLITLSIEGGGGPQILIFTIIGGRWVVSENLTVEGNLANGRRVGGPKW